MESKAIVLNRKGPASKAFELKSIKLPDLGPDEILIESEVFGLNYADVMARNGLYRDAPLMPCVIGYEVVGKVIEIGEGADTSLLNQRVLAFCRFGGYGKHVITKSYAAIPVDDHPSEELLALCTQAVTAYYMTDILSPVLKNDKVLIHAAAGGVGTILIQLAKRRGAEVIAKVGNEEKGKLAIHLGADHAVNYKQRDYAQEIREVLGGASLDISYNAVGGSTFKKDWKLLGSGGRLFLFGGAELSGGSFGIFSSLNFLRKMGFIVPAVLMMGSRSILGVNMLKIADTRPEIMHDCLQEVVGLYTSQKLKIHAGGSFSASQIGEAHELLESGGSKGKIAVFWD